MRLCVENTALLLAFSCASIGGSRAVAGQECIVRGERVTLEEVTVRPQGARPFKLGLEGVPASARIPKKTGREISLVIEGAITFHASRKNVWLTVTTDYKTSDGLIKISRSAHLTNVRAEGENLVGAAVLYSDDVMEGENKTPHETVSPIRMPCSMTTLDWLDIPDEEEDGTGADSATTADGATMDVWWEMRAKKGRARLHAAPKKTAPTVLLVTPHCNNCLELAQIGEQGAWLQVERFGEGVSVSGWIPRNELKRIPDDVLAGGRSYGCTGDHGGGGWGEGSAGGPPSDRYEGPAIVRAGTKVFSDPPKGEWATITKDLKVNVRFDKGDQWVELRHIPGLDGSPSGSPWLNAYVPASAAVVPASADKP